MPDRAAGSGSTVRYPAGPPAPLAARSELGTRWVTVATRSDGTGIFRVEGGPGYHVKTAPPRDPQDLRFHPVAEAARLTWLAGRGFPVPEVVEVGEDAETSWLITRTVAGRPAGQGWNAAERLRIIDMVAELTRALHAVPATDCPFDRGLAVSLHHARVAVQSGLIDLDDLDERHRGWTAQQLLAELEATPIPAEDPVVCHGDLCLDNILIAPETLTVAAVLDVGRLGRADRWVDLAIVLRNIAEEGLCHGYGAEYAERFRRRYGLPDVDSHKFEYYRLVDEFL